MFTGNSSPVSWFYDLNATDSLSSVMLFAVVPQLINITTSHPFAPCCRACTGLISFAAWVVTQHRGLCDEADAQWHMIGTVVGSDISVTPRRTCLGVTCAGWPILGGSVTTHPVPPPHCPLPVPAVCRWNRQFLNCERFDDERPMTGAFTER